MPLARAGQADSFFISRVRRDLRDQPVWFQESFPTDGVQGSVTAVGSKPFRLKRAPVVAAGAAIFLNGAAQTVSYDVAPGVAPSVTINTEQGELYWANPPAAAATIQATYQVSRFSDTQILEALQDGMQEMWPDIWLPVTDTSLLFSPMLTEYTLPAPLQDSRAVIMSLELQPPAGILVSIPTGMYRRQGLQTLVMLRSWPAGSIMRITYNGSYANLSDLEAQVQHLPVYYANYKILTDQESMRTRQSDLVAQTGEGASQPEIASKTAALWLQRFEQARTRLSVPAPIREDVPQRATELLEMGSFTWNPPS